MFINFQIESSTAVISWQWNDVLESLLDLLSLPVIKELHKNGNTTSTDLSKYCCHLLSRVLAELVYQCHAAEVSCIDLRFSTFTLYLWWDFSLMNSSESDTSSKRTSNDFRIPARYLVFITSQGLICCIILISTVESEIFSWFSKTVFCRFTYYCAKFSIAVLKILLFPVGSFETSTVDHNERNLQFNIPMWISKGRFFSIKIGNVGKHGIHKVP